MPTYNASSADPNIAAQAYQSAIKLTADPKILLALFEAGLVESNFHNDTTATDHDSLGYLQQRPSQGWPNPTDIATATKSFISRAVANSARNPGFTAGQLAQSVQRSAYPERYDQAQGAAQQLLAKTGGTGGLAGVIADPAGAAGGLLDGLTSAITQAFAPLTSVGHFADQVYKVFLPSNFIRLAAGIAGIVFILFGIFLLTKEVRNG